MIKINKYELYEHSVQDPDVEARFIRSLYKRTFGKPPLYLREDFCGTFKLCCEWVKMGKDNKAVGVDLDREPISYGKKNHLERLPPQQQSRIKIIRGNVLHTHRPIVDVVGAFNFSYYIFKTRADLVAYFKSAYKSIGKKGMIVVDAFGGTDAMDANVEKRVVKGKGYKFTYIWEQKNYNVIRNEAEFNMHFKMSNGRVMRNAFQYDWRMWTLPEIREAMREAGFKKTSVYWEGVDKHGRGNGHFRALEYDDACEVWIAYIVGIK